MGVSLPCPAQSSRIGCGCGDATPRGGGRRGRVGRGAADNGAHVEEPAEEAEPDGAARQLRETLERRLERLQAPPCARLDAAAFVSTQMRQLAALKARCTPRQWQLHEDATDALKLTTAQWLEAEALRSDAYRR